MKYIYNSGRYDLKFTVALNNRPFEVEFIRRRIFLDTGNVATSGITKIDDKVYDALKELKPFKKLMDNKTLVLTDEPKPSPTDTAELEAENKKLKEALKEAEKKSDDKESKKELEAKNKEIASLKEQLEALTKTKKGKTASANKEGF